MNDVTADRVRVLLDAYGADPGRWPEAERDAALRVMATDPGLAADVAAAAEVDVLLDALPDPAPSPALRVSLKDIPDHARSGWLDRLAALWPFEAPWRPAAGLVAAAVVGIVVGVSMPDVGTADASETVAFHDPVADAAAMASGASALEFRP